LLISCEIRFREVDAAGQHPQKRGIGYSYVPHLGRDESAVVNKDGLVARSDSQDAEVSMPKAFVEGRRPDGRPQLPHAWCRTIDGVQGGTWTEVHLLGTQRWTATGVMSANPERQKARTPGTPGHSTRATTAAGWSTGPTRPHKRCWPPCIGSRPKRSRLGMTRGGWPDGW
jgi:hypothetical protein